MFSLLGRCTDSHKCHISFKVCLFLSSLGAHCHKRHMCHLVQAPVAQYDLGRTVDADICLTFLHCVFLDVSAVRLHKRMKSHIGCICLTFLRCVLSNVSSKHLHERMHCHIGCTCLSFLHCVFSNVSSKCSH